MSIEAFTVGYAKSYDQALADHVPGAIDITKLGKYDDYPGGWVWQTAEAAHSFLSSREFAEAFPDRDPGGFAVYGVQLPTDWDADVTPKTGKDGVHNLLNNALITGRWHGTTGE